MWVKFPTEQNHHIDQWRSTSAKPNSQKLDGIGYLFDEKVSGGYGGAAACAFISALHWVLCRPAVRADSHELGRAASQQCDTRVATVSALQGHHVRQRVEEFYQDLRGSSLRFHIRWVSFLFFSSISHSVRLSTFELHQIFNGFCTTTLSKWPLFWLTAILNHKKCKINATSEVSRL